MLKITTEIIVLDEIAMRHECSGQSQKKNFNGWCNSTSGDFHQTSPVLAKGTDIPSKVQVMSIQDEFCLLMTNI